MHDCPTSILKTTTTQGHERDGRTQTYRLLQQVCPELAPGAKTRTILTLLSPSSTMLSFFSFHTNQPVLSSKESKAPRDRGGKGKRRPNRTIADQYTFAYPECSAYPEYSKINFWPTIFPHLDQNLSIHLNQIQFFVPVTTPFVMVVTTFVMVVTTLSPVGFTHTVVTVPFVRNFTSSSAVTVVEVCVDRWWRRRGSH